MLPPNHFQPSGGTATGAGTRRINKSAPTDNAPTLNEIKVAHNGWPTAPRNDELTPVCTGSAAPAKIANKKFSTPNS